MRCFPALRYTMSFCLGVLPIASDAQHYMQKSLTSDQSGMATNTDANLVNPWGLSRASGSPWWVSDNGMGLATLYDGTGAARPLVVTIPTGDAKLSATGSPTGTVFNGGMGFELATGKPALFLFVTEDGTISGWNPGVNPKKAVIMVNTHSASVFKGVALAQASISGTVATYLYAADFRGGRVIVYDSSFHPVAWMSDETFDDDSLPPGYAPFNIQNIGGDLYVTFAKQDSAKHDEVDGAGLGYVDVFSPKGGLKLRLQHGDWLNGPWGLAMAPGDFGVYSHDLLVGQFGSGQIVVYDPATGLYVDKLRDAANKSISIGGLWGLSFASGGISGSATTLYFSAGTDHEQHGTFGMISPIENPYGNSR